MAPGQVARSLSGILLRVIVSVGLAVVLMSALPKGACALEDGQRVASGFPRLGLMWPDPSTQPLSDIAAFDYVCLHPWDRDAVAPLRQLNDGMTILTSANAVELTIDPALPATAADNQRISSVPNSWIQTQLGSTLAVGAGPHDTVLQVHDSTRFRAGDILVIGDELATVVSVGSGNLTVARGALPERSPAASHAAGTRVAAAVVFWPGSVVMDLSDYCPRVTVDSGVGPETWAEYSARQTVQLVRDGDWDGVFIDRCNSNAFINKVFTRSIDPKRDNTAVTDGYAALNASWNNGLRKYESLVRTGVAGKIVLGNNAHPYHDLINGTVLESMPRSVRFGPDNWLSGVLGTHGRSNQPGGRSYVDFVASSRQPNLTTLQVYDDDGYSPTSGVTKTNPALSPGWKPTYRKMRFGLSSALMSDGFFAYEVGTYGHAALALMRFDEYDNVGRAPGYLGKPTAAARPARPALSTNDLLAGDGSFSSSARLSRWGTWANSGYAVSKSGSDGTAKISVAKSRGNAFGATLYHRNVPVQYGAPYTLTFRAKASTARRVSGYLEKNAKPYTNRGSFGTFYLDTSWKTFSAVIPAKGTDSTARIVLAIGEKTGTIWLDDVKIQKGSRTAAHRRDFQNGVALVNPELTPVTIPLGGTFKKIQGIQDPITNNGAYVSSITLQSKDGIILLKTPSLTIPANRTIDYGSAATLSGSLKSVPGSPLSGRSVELLSSADGSKWTKKGTATTSANGTYAFTVKPQSKTYYKVNFLGDPNNFRGFSNVMSVNVRPAVGTPVAPKTVKRGRSFTVYGSLKPGHAAGTKPVRIYRYRKVGGKWKNRGYVTAKAYSYNGYTRYKVKLKLTTSGSWRLRAYAPADSRHVAKWSAAYVSVRVK